MPRNAVSWLTVTRTAKELTVPYRSVNPATGEVLKTFTEHTDQEMMGALATADKAFVSWACRRTEERAKILSRAAQLLLERKSELAKLATLEMGKRDPHCPADATASARCRLKLVSKGNFAVQPYFL
jgi:succinate-semialdehyde dehydrogenase/glutarate-semialdehyde dehydrogenase